MNPIQVENYWLWPDGTISVDPDLVIDYVFRLSTRGIGLDRLYVTSTNQEITSFNSISEHKLEVKSSCNFVFPPDWKLPAQYFDLDLDDYLLALVDHIEKDDLYEKRVERLSKEIWMFKLNKLEDVLRTLIYVIDTMKEKNVIWGVGRGSSCSSYLLFLLGLHEVDSVKFDIEIEDFLHV